MPTITFIPVSDNTAKLKAIVDVASTIVASGQKILIAVPSTQAADYVDALLWRLPEEGFLPHTIADHDSDASCIITTHQSNWNKASVLLNLRQEAPPFFAEFESVYDLWDETDPAKAGASRARKSAYETAGHSA